MKRHQGIVSRMLFLAMLSTVDVGVAWGQGFVTDGPQVVAQASARQLGGGGAKPVKPKVCYPGLASVQNVAEGFSLCVPDGFEERQRGSEHVWSDGKGLELVMSLQIKVTSPDDVLSLIVPFLKKSGAEVEMLPDHRLRFKGDSGRGMAFGKHQHRYGALLYSSCAEPYPDCVAAEEIARSFANSFEFLDETVAPYGEWKIEKTGHLEVLAYPEGATGKDKDWLAREYEKGYESIRSALGLAEVKEPVRCFFYPGKHFLQMYTRRDSGFAIADKGEIHSWYEAKDDRQSTGHEMTHVITFWAWGEPAEALLGEGIAVAMDLSGRDVHKAAAEVLAIQGGEFMLAAMLGNGWFKAPPEVAYAVSGSFAKFLLDRGGPEKLAEIYRAPDFIAALQSVYGLSLEQAQKEWNDTIGR